MHISQKSVSTLRKSPKPTWKSAFFISHNCNLKLLRAEQLWSLLRNGDLSLSIRRLLNNRLKGQNVDNCSTWYSFQTFASFFLDFSISFRNFFAIWSCGGELVIMASWWTTKKWFLPFSPFVDLIWNWQKSGKCCIVFQIIIKWIWDIWDLFLLLEDEMGFNEL